MRASATLFAAALALAAAPWCSTALVVTPERSLMAHVNHFRQHDAPSLEREVGRLEQEAEARLGLEKDKLEAQLRMQRAQNKMASGKNERILKAVQAFRADCSSLRAEGERLLEDCELLAADIETISKNSSVAVDFLGGVLNETDFALWQSPEVKVLADLDDLDEAKDKEKVTQHALEEMTRAAKHQAALAKREALLQRPAVHDTMSSLLTSVEDFQRKQNSSFMQLHQAFDEKMRSLRGEYKATVEEQGRLNLTRAQERERKAKLTQAVEHLRKARNVLFERSTAIRHFAAKLGHTLPAWQPLAVEKPERAAALEAARQGTKSWSILGKLMGSGSAHVRSLLEPFAP